MGFPKSYSGQAPLNLKEVEVKCRYGNSSWCLKIANLEAEMNDSPPLQRYAKVDGRQCERKKSGWFNYQPVKYNKERLDSFLRCDGEAYVIMRLEWDVLSFNLSPILISKQRTVAFDMKCDDCFIKFPHKNM